MVPVLYRAAWNVKAPSDSFPESLTRSHWTTNTSPEGRRHSLRLFRHQKDGGRVQTSYHHLSTAQSILWSSWGQNWPWVERCTVLSSACGEWRRLWKWTLGGVESRWKNMPQFQITHKTAQDLGWRSQISIRYRIRIIPPVAMVTCLRWCP